MLELSCSKKPEYRAKKILLGMQKSKIACSGFANSSTFCKSRAVLIYTVPSYKGSACQVLFFLHGIPVSSKMITSPGPLRGVFTAGGDKVRCELLKYT